jgi:hypothetical protein
MAPKLKAKARWRVSMARRCTQAVSNVEFLPGTGASEGSLATDNQLMVFESYEHGLMATWEKADELVCV